MSDIRDELNNFLKIIRIMDGEEWETFGNEIEKILQADIAQRENLQYGPYWINAVSVGLSRFLDELLPNWIDNNNIILSLQDITSRANLYLQLNPPAIQSQICGHHENGACIKAPLGARCTILSPLIHKFGNFDLIPNHAENFVSTPRPIKVSKAIKIQRIVNSKKTHIIGHWWKIGHYLPWTKCEWRKKYAVLKLWNDDSWYTDAILNPNMLIWYGRAASQKVVWVDDNNNEINEECILKGGAEQILIDPASMLNITHSLNPTRWK